LVHDLRHCLVELLWGQLFTEGLQRGGIELGEDGGDGMAGHGGIQQRRKSDGTRRCSKIMKRSQIGIVNFVRAYRCVK
jgi:hypothetical protein